MHSSQELNSSIFQIEADGQPVTSFADLCPEFSAADRVGIIVRSPLEVIESAALITAAVTAFYDEQRKSGKDFWIYPDYFTFHLGCEADAYSHFDIWPTHKNVRVNDDPEELLCAINDRAVNILVLHRATPREVGLGRHTRNAALSRIRHAFLYRDQSDGQANVSIRGGAPIEQYRARALWETATLTDDERESFRQRHAAKGSDPVEWYQRISPEEALMHL